MAEVSSLEKSNYVEEKEKEEGEGEVGDYEEEGEGEDEGEVVNGVFRRYASITSGEGGKNYKMIINEGFTNDDVEWVMTEKVHGANFSIICSNDSILCAKRTSILTEDDVFYNYKNVIQELNDKIRKALDILYNKFGKTDITFYGELFGGIYPHKEVPKVDDVKHVQKGVYYSPKVQVYMFDIWVKGHSFLSFDLFQSICEEVGFIYSKPLARGKFSDLIKFDISTFHTTLPQLFLLPPIPNNIAEGIVLKTVQNKYTNRGGRVIVKLKSEAFKEVTGVLNPKSKIKTPKNVNVPKMSPEVKDLCDNVERYVTANRLKNVLSKIGPVSPSDKSKVMGLMSRDVLKDFEDDYELYKTLPKNDQKFVTQRLGPLVRNLIEKNWKKILNNDF